MKCKVTIPTSYYNANTNLNVESNRTDAMEYLYQNYYAKRCGITFTVRYAGGYGFQYIFLGAIGTSYGNVIIEIPMNNISSIGLCVWLRAYNGDYIKGLSLT